jgi:hypothetical protein
MAIIVVPIIIPRLKRCPFKKMGMVNRKMRNRMNRAQ